MNDQKLLSLIEVVKVEQMRLPVALFFPPPPLSNVIRS
jgi:hypothetical protein